MREMSNCPTSLNKALGTIQMTIGSCWGLSLNLGWKELLLEVPMCSSRTQLFAILPERVKRVVREFLFDFTSLNFWFLIHPIAIPPTTMYGARLRQIPTTMPATSRLSWWSKSSRYLKILKIWDTVKNACVKIWSSLEVAEEAEGGYLVETYLPVIIQLILFEFLN